MTSIGIGFILFATAHDLNNWTRLFAIGNHLAWDIRFVVKRSSQQSNQPDPDQKYKWLGYIGTKGWGTIEIIPSSISFAVFAPAYDLNDWTLLCWGENMCPEH